jgi:hypothetical protein
MFLPTFRFASIGALLVLLSMPGLSQPAQTQPDWLRALRQGGHVVVFRHGATHADQADTDPLNPKKSRSSVSSTSRDARSQRRSASPGAS